MPKKRAHYYIPTRINPLVAQLFELIHKSGRTYTALAIEVGVENNTFCNWKHQKTPRLENLLATGNAIGYELQWVRMQDANV